MPGSTPFVHRGASGARSPWKRVLSKGSAPRTISALHKNMCLWATKGTDFRHATSITYGPN